MQKTIRYLTAIALLVVSATGLQRASADTFIVDSSLTDSYHFIDTYEILIDRPAADVWEQTLDFASWMYQFDMIHVSGSRNAEGAIYRLYEGEPFLVEVAKIIPGRLVVLVNHPSAMQGEESIGMSMLSLTEHDGKTLVSSVMSRQYDWLQAPPNLLRDRRGSDDFQRNTRNTWNGFLNRLRELSEGARAGDQTTTK